MYNQTTSGFNDAISERNQKRKIKIIIKYKNSAGVEIEEELGQDNIVSGSFVLTSSCIPSSNLEIGGTISKDLSFTIYNNNQKYSGCKFLNGTAKPFFGLVLADGSVEWCPLGTYIIDESGKTFGKTISIKAVDFLLKFEKNFDNFENNGSTLADLLTKMCLDLGVTCDTSFLNNAATYTMFDRSGLTYRDVLGFIACAAGGFAYVNKQNVLEIRGLDTSHTQVLELSPDGTRYSCEIDEPITIDSVAYYRDGAENKIVGEGVYSLTIKNNKLFDSLNDLDSVLNNIYNKYNGFTYYPVSVEYMGDPRLEPGDTLKLLRTEAGDIYTFSNQIRLTLTGTSSISTPSCSELDKGFFDNKNRKETKTEGGNAPETNTVNKNLLLLSLFTKATLPYSFVSTWEAGTDPKYANARVQGSGGVECLNMLDMGYYVNSSKEIFPKLWLPCTGIIQGNTYTLSLLLKPLIKDKPHMYKSSLCPVNVYLVKKTKDTSSYNNIMPIGTRTTWGTSVAEQIATIEIDSNDWKWYSVTFMFNKNPNDYCLGLMSTYAGDPIITYSQYTCYVYKAKLEEGEKMTDWCLSENEHISQDVLVNTEGYITKTLKANTKSVISDYGTEVCLIEPINIFYDAENGITKEGIQETTIKNATAKKYELQYMIKSTNSINFDDSGAVFTKQYRDSSNNFYIDCNNFYLNGNISTGGSGSGGSSGDSGSGDSGNTGGSGDSGSGDSGNTGGSSEVTGDEASTYTDTTGHSYFELDSGTVDNMTSKQVVSFFDNDITTIISDYENNNSDEYSNKVLSDWYFYITARLEVDSNLSTYIANNSVDSKFSNDSYISDYDKYFGYIDNTGYAYEEIDSNYLDSLTARRLYLFFESDIVPIKDYYAENGAFEGWQDESKADGWYVYINARREADEYLQEYISSETIDDYFINKFY